MTKKYYLLIFLCAIVVVSGCGKPNRGTVPVSVEIIYQDKPVAEASVTILNPEGKYAVGVTDANGKARLFTYEPNDGAMPGQYKVAVDKHDTIFPEAPKSAAEDRAVSDSNIKHIYHVPKKYADSETSGLSLEVVKGEKNHFVFDLK